MPILCRPLSFLISLLTSLPFFVTLFWSSLAAAEGPVALNFEIPSGSMKTVRLRNLPQGAVVAVVVESSGTLLVALVDSSDYQQRFPDSSGALFLGRVDRRLSFSVSIPKKAHYLLVFDNRSGEQSRAVRVKIRATRPGGGVEL
jgi:hypothetical protein